MSKTSQTTFLPFKIGNVEELAQSSASSITQVVVPLEQFQVVVRALKDLLEVVPISSDPSTVSAIQQARVLVKRHHVPDAETQL
jgi:hypothetical protein